MTELSNLRFTGGSGETKTFLCFALPAAVLTARLPEGWRIAPSADPAMMGVNLKVVLSENLVALDPSGRPPVTQRFVALVVDAAAAGSWLKSLIQAFCLWHALIQPRCGYCPMRTPAQCNFYQCAHRSGRKASKLQSVARKPLIELGCCSSVPLPCTSWRSEKHTMSDQPG